MAKKKKIEEIEVVAAEEVKATEPKKKKKAPAKKKEVKAEVKKEVKAEVKKEDKVSRVLMMLPTGYDVILESGKRTVISFKEYEAYLKSK